MHIISRIASMLALAVGVFLSVPGPAAGAGLGSWTQLEPQGLPADLPPFVQVACPGRTVCYALGNHPVMNREHPVLVTTRDGGASWSARPVNGIGYSAARVQPLSCPSVTTCYLLAATGDPGRPQTLLKVTTDGGKTWTDRHPPKVCSGSTCDGPLALSCPSLTVCYAIEWSFFKPPAQGVLLVTRNGGVTWKEHTLAGYGYPPDPLYGLACPGVDDCYLSGMKVVPSGGRTGATAPGISATHDGGRTWTVVRSGVYGALACPDVRHCYAAAARSLIVTSDQGRSWTQHNLPNTQVSNYRPAIACPGPTTCYVVEPPTKDTSLWRTTNGGASWQPQSADPDYIVLALACPGLTTCYGAGIAGMIVKTSDGQSWREPTLYTRQNLVALACPGAGTCYVVGRSGTILTTTDGGATWIRRSSGTHADLSSIACPSALVCFVIVIGAPGETLLVTHDGGKTWGKVTPTGTLYLQAITCPDATVCYAAAEKVGGAGKSRHAAVIRITDGGRTWTVSTLPPTDTSWSVACSAPSRCVVVGGTLPCIDDRMVRAAFPRRSEQVGACTPHGWVYGTTDGGVHWRRELDVKGGTHTMGGAAFTSASCPTVAQCYAIGYLAWARSTGSGSAWAATVPDRFAGDRWIEGHSLSCTDTSTCWALAGDGNDWAGLPIETTNAGRSWRLVAGNVPIPDQGDEAGLLALTCPTSNRCYGAGYGGLIMSYST